MIRVTQTLEEAAKEHAAKYFETDGIKSKKCDSQCAPSAFEALLAQYGTGGDFESPDYYTHNGIDAKDLMFGFDYWKGSAISHILRAGKKPGESEKEALENAVICLLRRIKELK